jgi:hypothetical protein
MRAKSFSGIAKTGHKEEAIEVPFDPGAVWRIELQPIRPGRRGYRVTGVVNGFRFSSHVVARSKKFWLLLPAGVVTGAKIRLGRIVAVKLQPENVGGLE